VTECYRCGQEGHRAAECDAQPAPPPRPDPLAQFRRSAGPVADAHAWAEKIRRQFGWEKAEEA
jgi:zinc knuckle protein